MSDSAAVLLALHYQNEVLHPEGKIRLGLTGDSPLRDGVVAAARRLLGGVRGLGLPVVSVRIAYRPDYSDVVRNCTIFRNVVAIGAMPEGSWGAGFYDGLGPIERPGEHVVTHNRVNAFYGTELETLLQRLQARRLVVAGVATNSVVEHTVRHAADMGYEVLVASDACAAGDPELHRAALRNMALLADVMTADEVVARLARIHGEEAAHD